MIKLKSIIKEETTAATAIKNWLDQPNQDHFFHQPRAGDEIKDVVRGLEKEWDASKSKYLNIDDYLKNLEKTDGLKDYMDESVNEGVFTIAGGVILGLIGLKLLKKLVKKVIGTVGLKVPLPKEKLHQFVEEAQKTILEKAPQHALSMAPAFMAMKDQIDSGEVKTTEDFLKALDTAAKEQGIDESVNEGSSSDYKYTFGNYEVELKNRQVFFRKNGKAIKVIEVKPTYGKHELKVMAAVVAKGVGHELAESVNEAAIDGDRQMITRAIENMTSGRLKVKDIIIEIGRAIDQSKISSIMKQNLKFNLKVSEKA